MSGEREHKEIAFKVREEDKKKLIQSFLALSVTNFEKGASPMILRVSESLLGGDHEPAQRALRTYLEELEEFRGSLQQISDLIDEHIFLDSSRTLSATFPVGENMSGDEFNEKMADAQKRTREKKEEVKKKVEKKARSKKASKK